MSSTPHPVLQAFIRAMTTPPLCTASAGAMAFYVGYSGGADSTVLLSLMADYAASRGIPCTAVHVHHGIRGEEADRDAAHCRQFCEERGIPFLIRVVDVPAYARENRLGLEEAAREMRYRLFAELTEVDPTARLCTAHSADDQLETILHRLLRGTALDGLRGIPPVRGSILRPLLSCSAADIRDYCRVTHLPYMEDSTNMDIAYTRNYIRREIVPRLRHITPVPEEAVSRMSMLVAEDADYLNDLSRRALGAYATAVRAPLHILSPLPDPILRRALARLWANTGAAGSLSAHHIGEMLALLRRGTASQRTPLPGGYAARIFDGHFCVIQEEACHPIPAEYHRILTPGDHFFPEFGFCLRYEPEESGKIPKECTDGKNVYKLATWNSFPFAIIRGEVCVRTRRGGDTIRQGGMTKQVKKLLHAAHIPPEERGVYPILTDADGILCIPGVAVRDGHTTGKRMRLSLFRTIRE